MFEVSRLKLSCHFFDVLKRKCCRQFVLGSERSEESRAAGSQDALPKKRRYCNCTLYANTATRLNRIRQPALVLHKHVNSVDFSWFFICLSFFKNLTFTILFVNNFDAVFLNITPWLQYKSGLSACHCIKKMSLQSCERITRDKC